MFTRFLFSPTRFFAPTRIYSNYYQSRINANEERNVLEKRAFHSFVSNNKFDSTGGEIPSPQTMRKTHSLTSFTRVRANLLTSRVDTEGSKGIDECHESGDQSVPTLGIGYENTATRTFQRRGLLSFPRLRSLFRVNVEPRSMGNGKNAVDAAGRTRGGHGRERVQGRCFPWMPAASFDAFYPESWIPRVPVARLAPSTGTRTVIGPFQQDRRCPWDDDRRRLLQPRLLIPLYSLPRAYACRQEKTLFGPRWKMERWRVNGLSFIFVELLSFAVYHSQFRWCPPSRGSCACSTWSWSRFLEDLLDWRIVGNLGGKLVGLGRLGESREIETHGKIGSADIRGMLEWR